MATYGTKNNVANFGTFQQAVTFPVPASGTTTTIVFINKSTFTVGTTLNLAVKVSINTPHFGTMMNEEDKFYFVVFDATSKNFQSYYLATDGCTSRDTRKVCKLCSTGLVRYNLQPDNICVAAADYSSLVEDKVNGLLSSCAGNSAAPIGDGCIATDCSGTGSTTKCITCDVLNNFFHLSGVCYAMDKIPDGYGVATQGQQNLEAFSDTSCKKCSANKNTCTEKKTDSSTTTTGSSSNKDSGSKKSAYVLLSAGLLGVIFSVLLK